MARNTDAEAVIAGLWSIFLPYAPRLTVDFDKPGGYSLSGPVHPKVKNPMFFGAAQICKNCIAFCGS